ncbi:MAG: DUF4249 family protein [Bacteroidales bacterium]|nr:DUF4249 family protein [Bacteroidales bacterium]MBN2748797.1 DUF4249 family protein [Bacteroidales bacterium]
MKQYLLIILLATIATLVSCEKILDYTTTQIDYNGVPHKSMLVVSARYYCDLGLKIHVDRSLSIAENPNLPPLAQVKVTLTKKGGATLFSNLVTLGSTSGKAFISKDSLIELPTEGETLILSVECNGFDPVEGETTIPQTVPINNFSVTGNESKSNTFQFTLNFDDPANSTNYYFISSVEHTFAYPTWNNDTTHNIQRITIPLTDPIFSFMPDFRTSIHEPFNNSIYKPRIFPDTPISGKSYSLKIDIPEKTDYQQTLYDTIETEYTIELFSISKELFEAYKSIYLAEIVAGDIYSEPITQYSNMSNGIGFFGSVSPRASKTIRLEKNRVLEVFNGYTDFHY